MRHLCPLRCCGARAPSPSATRRFASWTRFRAKSSASSPTTSLLRSRKSDTTCEYLRYSVGLVDDAFKNVWTTTRAVATVRREGREEGGEHPRSLRGDRRGRRLFQNAYSRTMPKWQTLSRRPSWKRRWGSGCLITTRWVRSRSHSRQRTPRTRRGPRCRR